MDFDALIGWEEVEEGVFEGSFPEEWYQGRGAFGGVVVAAMIRGLEAVVNDESKRLRSMQVQFCGPLVAEKARLEVEIQRRGSSVINASAKIVQKGEVKTTALALYGGMRNSAIDFEAREMPDVPPPEEVDPAPESPLFPKFSRHYEYRFCNGAIPYTGSEEATGGGWCRPIGDTKAADEARVAALLDAWAPAILARATAPTPAATISWNIHLYRPLPLEDADADDFYLIASESQIAVNGYADEQTQLWSEEGELIAEGSQLVAVFG